MSTATMSGQIVTAVILQLEIFGHFASGVASALMASSLVSSFIKQHTKLGKAILTSSVPHTMYACEEMVPTSTSEDKSR